MQASLPEHRFRWIHALSDASNASLPISSQDLSHAYWLLIDGGKSAIESGLAAALASWRLVARRSSVIDCMPY